LLLGESPSLASVWKAALIAVSWPTAVFEASSIVWMSFRSVWSALASAEFVELLSEPESPEQSPAPVVVLPVLVELELVPVPVLLELVPVLVELVVGVAKLAEVLAVLVEVFAALAELLVVVVECCET
jgi:hypothetical protein